MLCQPLATLRTTHYPEDAVRPNRIRLRRVILTLAAVALGLAPVATAMPAVAAPVDNATRLYTLDGWGGVHAVGSSAAMTSSGYWSGWDIARGMALFANGAGGYTLDGWGGVHNMGSAPPIGDGTHAYWGGWDIARAVVLAPWATAANPAGWTMDGWGGIHAFGGAPAIADSSHTYWPSWDIARGMVVFPDSTPGGVSGYTLDGYGGLHGFHAGSAAMPPSASLAAYWPGWDIARSVALVQGTHTGYVVDGYGGLHGFAPTGTNLPNQFTDGSHAYWSGWDIARSVTTWTGAPAGSPGGWTIDGWGGVHAFGSAPVLKESAYWSGWDIARASAGAGSGSGARAPRPVRPTSRQLNVPYFHQDYALSCEAAALQMALGYEGIGASQADILNVMGIDYRHPVISNGQFHWGDPYANFVGDPNGSEVNNTGYGTYASTVFSAAGHYGGNVVTVAEGFAASDVYNAILDGHPVIAWIAFDYANHTNTNYSAFDGRVVQFGSPYEHAVTVVGVNDSSVVVNDPWRGPMWVSKGTFETGYAVFNHMAVVLN